MAKESSFVESYEQKLELPLKSSKKKANIYGLCFGFAQCVIFMAYAASFRYGGYLVAFEGLQFNMVFRLVEFTVEISYFSYVEINFVFYVISKHQLSDHMLFLE